MAVENGRISDVGAIGPKDGVPTLEAAGLFVAPGFIDIHSHSDFTLLMDPRAVSAVTQGVTLELIGNCGHGCAPIVDSDLARSLIYGSRMDFPVDWRTMGQYLDRLEAAQPAVNVLTLVPNGLLRLASVAQTDRPSTAAELKRMKKLLAACVASVLSTRVVWLGPTTRRWRRTGPWGDSTFHGAYTWASCFYHHFVHDTATLRPEEAVLHLASLPAQRLALPDRGTVKKGAWADLAVFDPATFAERGTTYELNQTAQGMVHVVVNGTVSVKDGHLTTHRGGQVLRS